MGRVCSLSEEAAFYETPCDVVPRGNSLERFTVVGFSVEDDSLDQRYSLIALFQSGEKRGAVMGGDVAKFFYRCPGSMFHTRSQ